MSERWIEVEMSVASKWPSTAESARRNRVIERLDAIGIGTCTGAGGGMGKMDFSYRVADDVTAREAIALVMPEIPFTIRVSPAT
jgi:hypothetical protein